jgi:hypothetical protein
MTTIPHEEYQARLKQYIDDHGGPQGSGFCGRLGHYTMMERMFYKETGLVPYWPPSQARSSSFKDFIHSEDRPASHT